jgi:hypothetical protein
MTSFQSPPPIAADISQSPPTSTEPIADTPWPRGAVTKNSSKKAQKVVGKAQFRDEIIIRNTDSGKSEYINFLSTN